MRFVNKYILLFILIVTVTAISFYLLLQHLLEAQQYSYVALITVGYMVIIFLSAFILGRKDIYEGYYGFNYHMFTYMVCNAVPIILSNAGAIHTEFELSTYRVMPTWGIGLAIHFIVFLVLRRKRSLKGFDKREIFD